MDATPYLTAPHLTPSRADRLRRIGFAVLVTLLASVSSLAAQKPYSFHHVDLGDGTRLEYALLLPEDFDPSRAYPAVLALPPGGQNRDMASAALYPWASEGRKRGWIGISPVAPGELFFQGAERYLPELLEHLRQQMKFEHDALHVLGTSNGGRSAFRVATLYPDQCLSITVAPGYPSGADQDRLEVIAELPITLIVGENDRGWLEGSRAAKESLEGLGATVELDVLPGQGHFIYQGIPASRFFEILERARRSARERRLP